MATPAFYPLKLYLKHPATAVFFGVALLLNGLSWGWIAFQVPRDVAQVFLHYTILFGVDTVGGWHDLFLPPLGGFLILLGNGLLGWWLFQTDKYLAHFLNAMAALVQVFLFGAAYLLVMLNA